jgi:hypothetical protein
MSGHDRLNYVPGDRWSGAYFIYQDRKELSANNRAARGYDVAALRGPPVPLSPAIVATFLVVVLSW